MANAIKWDSHGHRTKSNGLIDGNVVASIEKIANHSQSNKNIYTVKVGSTILDGTFQYIKIAREAAEIYYSNSVI